MIKEASKKIYSELINGRVINKHIYKDGQLTSNPLFDEIITDLESYHRHYSMMGFELAECGDSFYLRDEDTARYRDTPAMKIQGLLLIISRHAKDVGTAVEALKDVRAGLRRSSIETIGGLEEVRDILKACDMKGSLDNEIENNLVTRGLAFRNQMDALVLTDSGDQVFEGLFA